MDTSHFGPFDRTDRQPGRTGRAPGFPAGTGNNFAITPSPDGGKVAPMNPHHADWPLFRLVLRCAQAAGPV